MSDFEFEMETEEPSALLNPLSAIHLFERTVIVEGVPDDVDVLAEMHAWLTTELNKLGFAFHQEFRRRVKNLGLKWEDI